MTNIKESIQDEIRNYLYSLPYEMKVEQVEYVCEIVRQNFENYPSPSVENIHPDTKDNKRYNNADVDVDMLNQMYNQIL